MKAVFVTALVVTASVVTTSAMAQSHAPTATTCTCADAKVHGGWCTACKVGYVAGVKITSHKLFEAVQGKPVADVSKMKCPDCKAAFKNGGFCQHCNVGFVGHKAYKSKVGYALARGQAKDPASLKSIKCPKCKAAAAAGQGWCKMCSMGIVGNLVFTDKQAYEAAVKARATLVAANKLTDKCEGCAVAMVTDGTCKHCKVAFKDGKPQMKMGGMRHKAKP